MIIWLGYFGGETWCLKLQNEEDLGSSPGSLFIFLEKEPFCSSIFNCYFSFLCRDTGSYLLWVFWAFWFSCLYRLSLPPLSYSRPWPFSAVFYWFWFSLRLSKMFVPFVAFLTFSLLLKICSLTIFLIILVNLCTLSGSLNLKSILVCCVFFWLKLIWIWNLGTFRVPFDHGKQLAYLTGSLLKANDILEISLKRS